MSKPIIFISYSHKDENEKNELLKHLKVFNGEVDIWSDDDIQAGEDWYNKINLQIERSSIAILLVTPDFLGSDWIMNEEFPSLFKYQEHGLVIIPIIAKDCAWASVDLISRIQVLPKDGRPVWREDGKFADKELVKIAREIRNLLAHNTENNSATKQTQESLDKRTLGEMDYVIEDKNTRKKERATLDAEENALLDAAENTILDTGGETPPRSKESGALLAEDGGRLLAENGGALLTENEETLLDESAKEVDVIIEGLALSDAYSQIDLLGHSDYVEALANFITSPKTKKPITIGIDAAWGGGKTTLMRLLQERLNPRAEDKDKKSKKGAGEHINTVWFDAWKYDQQEMLWAAMVLEIFEQVREQFNWWRKIGLFFRLNKNRFDWTKFWLSLLKSLAITVFLFALGFGAFSILASFLEKTWAETLQWIEDYSRVLAALGLASLAYTIFKDTTGIIVSPFNLGISQYAKKPDYKEKIGFLNKFTKDFKYVIASITKDGEWPLVVFIDDLDRCSPTKAAEVIEAMNLLLDSEHCVFILGVDTAMLSRSIQAKYKDIQPFFEDGEYPSRLGLGRHFLEKIIQIDFHIPRPAPRHFSNFIDAQLGQTTSIEKKSTDKEQSEAENLIQAKQRSGKSATEAKESVAKERPDLKDVINDAVEAVKERTFENNYEVITAIKDMAPYLNYNPRRIKRFINIFRLQALITYQRGYLEATISFDNLARWIVVSMRWPDFIDFVRRNTLIAQHIKEDATYIEQKEQEIEFKIGVTPLTRYPEKIQELLLNQHLRNIITEITGNFQDIQNYLNLTEITTTYEQDSND